MEKQMMQQEQRGRCPEGLSVDIVLNRFVAEKMDAVRPQAEDYGLVEKLLRECIEGYPDEFISRSKVRGQEELEKARQGQVGLCEVLGPQAILEGARYFLVRFIPDKMVRPEDMREPARGYDRDDRMAYGESM